MIGIKEKKNIKNDLKYEIIKTKITILEYELFKIGWSNKFPIIRIFHP